MAKKSFGPAFPVNHVEMILAAKDYRKFMAIYMAMLPGPRKMTYASLARKAGFSSRSYVRGVVVGSKRLTKSSLDKFIEGLGLKGDWAEFFRLLVEWEHEDCRRRHTTRAAIETKLAAYKARLMARYGSQAPDDKVFSEHLPFIYAALGSLERGSTLKEIAKRTLFPANAIADLMPQLIAFGLVKQDGERFYALTHHIALADLHRAENFQRFFLSQLEKAKNLAKQNFANQDSLFFASCFSVSAAHLASLKEELRSLLLRYADNAEASEGDRVATLICALV